MGLVYKRCNWKGQDQDFLQMCSVVGQPDESRLEACSGIGVDLSNPWRELGAQTGAYLNAIVDPKHVLP